MRLDFPLSLLDQAIDIIIAQTGRDNAGTGFPPSGDHLPFGLDRECYLFIGRNTPAQQLGRDIAGGDLNNFASGVYIYSSHNGSLVGNDNESTIAYFGMLEKRFKLSR
jgi:hypothetical protein